MPVDAWSAILAGWSEVLDYECTTVRPPVEHDICPVCFAGRCYHTHDEAVHAVQHDAPVTLARFIPHAID